MNMLERLRLARRLLPAFPSLPLAYVARRLLDHAAERQTATGPSLTLRDLARTSIDPSTLAQKAYEIASTL
jgi:hypothetical protein